MTNKASKKQNYLTPLYWIFTGISFVALISARLIYPEFLGLTALSGLALLGCLVGLILENQKALKSRAAAFGLNSVITTALVLSIIGLLNFLSSKYFKKWDLTTNQKFTLSEQSLKLVRELTMPVTVTIFTADKERFRAILENYKTAGTKFSYEMVDPFREPTRFKASGLKKQDTAVITVGAREDKVDDLTEEKITNVLIKLQKDKQPILCVSTGHGEKDFNSNDAEGLSLAKKSILSQYYQINEINLLKDRAIATFCDTVGIFGPNKTYFAPEIQNLDEYLEGGGKLAIALDLNMRGPETNPELIALLERWSIKVSPNIVIDEISKLFGLEMTMAVSDPERGFSPDSSITKEFRSVSIFPLARPLVALPNPPASLKVQWLIRTMPQALESKIGIGKVNVDPRTDKPGPHNLMMSAAGKLSSDSKAKTETRIVAFASSLLVTNQFVNLKGGNLDLFMNAISWLMEDENLISIRAREDVAGKVELSEKSGIFILLLTILILPLIVGAVGVGVWYQRRKL